MQRTHDLRRRALFAAALFTVIAATLGAHGQTLPATPPTALPGQTTPGQTVPGQPTPGQTTPGQTTPDTPAAVIPPPNPAHHADVLYSNGQLQVRADNSSLNQILRSISHLTGLKITGGVEEQRVFGNYGPGPLSTVLATLIDGTGSNILLLGGGAKTPPELILTSRSGGPEPPSPDSPAYAMYDDSSDVHTPVSAPHTESPPAQPQTPAISGSGSISPPANHGNTPPPAATPAAPSASTPSKTLTPEMVEQQLIQMQAQQDLKKRQLDEKIQQQQIDQQKKLQKVKPQNPPSQPPASSNPQ
jgi:hypothetical protein